MKTIVSIDIGSTWTKGAAFRLEGGALVTSGRSSVPTTQDNLVRGFSRVLAELLGRGEGVSLEGLAAEARVFFSSSAKGGLGIAAIGLVPDLTLQLARLAAMSAGGKVVRSFSFSLTRRDVQELERSAPDIILLSGGTDGGNTAYVLENARRLADSSLSCPMVYAGNRAAADDVAEILKSKEVTLTGNLMPEVGQVNIEPAREKIRKIFLDRIISGRGLSELVRVFGNPPRPTPLAVFELVEAIPKHDPAWNDIAVIDLGGATTDFYSNTESFLETDSVVLKGIREPRVKRTVEGDLGLRVSARSLWEAGRDYAGRRLEAEGLTADDMDRFVAGISSDTGLLPTTAAGTRLDRILAETCVYYSAMRHIGGWREAYTPQGKVYVQTGKDLRRVGAVIGTGGYLSRSEEQDVLRLPFEELRRCGDEIKLGPASPRYFRDREYLFPLLGNLVEDLPTEAAALALASLEQFPDKGNRL